jgi:uncharacterized protein DUF6083
MHPNTFSTGCPRDGSPRTVRPRRPLRVAAASPSRPLRVAAASPSRLLRTGQSGRCRRCGNRIDFYPRADQRPIALHPAELATAHVPAACRWHLSYGIAHPHSDGSAWCRIPHTMLCPDGTPPPRLARTLRRYAANLPSVPAA